jgi:hypothetical protein
VYDPEVDDPLMAFTPPMDLLTANLTQVGGEHYRRQKIQHWDFVVANGLGYLEGCATKYICRHREKNGKQDLLKAIHYIQKIIEVEYGDK